MTMNLNPAQLALSGICAALLVVLGYLLFAPVPQVSLPPLHAHAESVADDAPLPRFEPPPMAAFAEIDDRSVFNPDRVRVSAPSVAGPTNAATLPSDLSLVGVILDGEKKLALIKSPEEPLAVGVSVGGMVEGWQVTRVEPDRVALRAGGPEQELMLTDNKGTAGAPVNNNPNGGPVGPGNFRRPFPRQNFPRPNQGENGPNGPNQNNANNQNNNNNSDDDDDNNN